MVKNIYPCPSLTFRLAHIRVLWECGEGVANNIFASKNYLQHFKNNTCYKEGVANNHFLVQRVAAGSRLGEGVTHAGGRCFKDGLGDGLGGLGGLGGCKTSIKRKWASGPGGAAAGGEVKWKRKRWEGGS